MTRALAQSSRTADELSRQLDEALAAARSAVGGALEGVASGDADPLRAAIEALAARLPASNAPLRRRHEDAMEELRREFDRRFDALASARRAAEALRAMTSPSGILATAPRALCEGSPFRRALLSVVRDGQLIAESVHVPGDAEAVLNELRAAPVPLEPPLIEVELLRRRRPALVSAADGQRRTAAPMGWRSFVAAPLLYGSRAVGILHADRGPTEPVEVHDRDTLWEFASTLSAAYESASLRRTLRRERQEMRRFLEWLNARSGTLNDARITLAGRPDVPALDAERRGSSAPVAGRDDRLVFADLLTSRELDVLRLLADGNSNRDVADMLVLSGATVKFHVNNILKRLHVSNRAEAVSRYLSLLGLPSP